MLDLPYEQILSNNRILKFSSYVVMKLLRAKVAFACIRIVSADFSRTKTTTSSSKAFQSGMFTGYTTIFSKWGFC
jgi:hypothetical protein